MLDNGWLGQTLVAEHQVMFSFTKEPKPVEGTASKLYVLSGSLGVDGWLLHHAFVLCVVCVVSTFDLSGWHLGLHSVGDSAIMTWPVTLVNLGGGLQLVEPQQCQRRFTFVPVLDLTGIMVAPVAWKSVAWQLRHVPAATAWSPHIRLFKGQNETCAQ